jgi:hypothetical protein
MTFCGADLNNTVTITRMQKIGAFKGNGAYK